eukprot:5407626-Amphidinium_carterae.1
MQTSLLPKIGFGSPVEQRVMKTRSLFGCVPQLHRFLQPLAHAGTKSALISMDTSNLSGT